MGRPGSNGASGSASAPTAPGTFMFRTSVPGSCTAIASTDRTCLKAACASIRISCCWILMPRSSAGSSSGPMNSLAISSAMRARICRLTIATARRSRRLAAVIDSSFDWSGEKRPAYPAHETLIYEAHVRGMTRLHPEVPEHLRGTYAGMASEPIIKHLQEMGVTALELMPVHYFVQDRHLVDRGLRNYWGYNTLGFFAPEMSYASNPQAPHEAVREFKGMVKILHNAGIEVILDVVYNHTAEGNQAGPTLSFRGIDNLAYYRTVPGDPRHYMDYTGCGNTLNMVHPQLAAAADGQPALLGDGNARRRLPLRSCLGAGARIEGCRSARRVLRHDLPGSHHGAGEIDCRTLGLGRGRIPGRQFSAGLDGVERQVSRHGAQVLEGRHGSALGHRHPPGRQRGSV